MRASSRLELLLLALAGAAIAAVPFARADEPRLLSTCTNCWPLSGAHAGSFMAPDGSEGMYVVWMDGNLRWRLQRLRPDLSVPSPWPASGLTLPTERLATRIFPGLVGDGAGGVYVTWVEQAANGDMSAWLLRIRGDGRPAKGWLEGGVRVASPSPMVMYPSVARLGKGAAVGWLEGRDGVARIRLAGFDAHGRALSRWPAEGLTLAESKQFGDAVILASDDRAGVFAAWTEMRDRLSDLKIAYASASGVQSWTAASDAVPVQAIQFDHHQEIVADGQGNAICVWSDERSQDRAVAKDLVDVFGQRIGPSGHESWTPSDRGGHPIAGGHWYQMDPHVAGDGKGGAFVSWNEAAPDMKSGQVVHLDAAGRSVSGWPAKGCSLGVEVVSVVPDLEGGVIVLSIEDSGLRLRRLEAEWHPGREPIEPIAFGPVGKETNVRIAADGHGGAFIAWEERNMAQTSASGLGAFNSQVWVQHVNFDTRVASPIVPLPTDPLPLVFSVRPIAPNPAVSRCRIAFDLQRQERVDIEVFDVAGRRVARVADDRLFEAGSQSMDWDLVDRRGSRIPPGLYLVRVTAGKNQAVARLTVTR